MSSVFAPDKDGLRLYVRLSPAASANTIDGLVQKQDSRYLKVRVTEPADKGKANKALIKFLAKELSCPKTHISLISGATDRYKVLLIAGDTNDLWNRVAQSLEGKI